MKIVSRGSNGRHRTLTVPTRAQLMSLFQSKRIMSDPQHHSLKHPPIYTLENLAITLERSAKPIPGHLV